MDNVYVHVSMEAHLGFPIRLGFPRDFLVHICMNILVPTSWWLIELHPLTRLQLPGVSSGLNRSVGSSMSDVSSLGDRSMELTSWGTKTQHMQFLEGHYTSKPEWLMTDRQLHISERIQMLVVWVRVKQDREVTSGLPSWTAFLLAESWE